MTEPVTRYEFEQLGRLVADNARRIESIDATGTRGVALLALQVQELSKDMAKHEDKHDREIAVRAASRRWIFGAVVAVVAAIDGPIVTVLLARGH